MALKVGFSKVDITPPLVNDLSIPILGFWWERAKVYYEIHDPLYARAAYFEDGDQFAIVSMDSIGDGIGLTDSIRHIASEETGIPPERIMIASTHTHTAPEIYDLCGHPVEKGFLDEMAGRVAESIMRAHRNLEPATMHVGSSLTKGLVINRRADFVKGKISTGELTSEEVARLSDLDEALRIFAFRRPDQSLVGTLVDFACHPVIMQTAPMISADHAGYVSEEVERRTGAVSLYLNGPSGDINPACGDTRNYEDVIALGTKLSSHVQVLLEDISRTSVADQLRLSASQDIVEVQRYNPPSKDELLEEERRYEAEIAARGTAPPPPQDALEIALFYVRELLELHDLPERYDAEVQVFSIGPHSIVGIPGELFTCLGRDIRKQRQSTMLFATLANRMLGDVAPREAFKAQEETPSRWSKLGPGSGETIRDAAIRLLRS